MESFLQPSSTSLVVYNCFSLVTCRQLIMFLCIDSILSLYTIQRYPMHLSLSFRQILYSLRSGKSVGRAIFAKTTLCLFFPQPADHFIISSSPISLLSLWYDPHGLPRSPFSLLSLWYNPDPILPTSPALALPRWPPKPSAVSGSPPSSRTLLPPRTSVRASTNLLRLGFLQPAEGDKAGS